MSEQKKVTCTLIPTNEGCVAKRTSDAIKLLFRSRIDRLSDGKKHTVQITTEDHPEISMRELSLHIDNNDVMDKAVDDVEKSGVERPFIINLGQLISLCDEYLAQIKRMAEVYSRYGYTGSPAQIKAEVTERLIDYIKLSAPLCEYHKHK